ncbi:MAG: DNA repair protein RecO [Bdellovibrionales bacterium]|nr:DNA repair protein RecO [Bdellovibrionales bacterium]NQZ19688.1 DNA repair protein RecO [Bdellovibrionales bacterium]
MPSGKFLLLRCKSFRESDLIIDALSMTGEKQTLAAMNALKSKRRFAGGLLEALYFVELHYTTSKAGHSIISEGRVIHGFPGLRQDYNKLEVAFKLVKTIQKGVQEGLPQKELFDLLGNSLKHLETTNSPQLLRLQFELKYLFYLGFHAPNKDTEEFISKNIADHESIKLTNDEFQYLTQLTHQAFKQVDLLEKDV